MGGGGRGFGGEGFAGREEMQSYRNSETGVPTDYLFVDQCRSLNQ